MTVMITTMEVRQIKARARMGSRGHSGRMADFFETQIWVFQIGQELWEMLSIFWFNDFD
ncbi:hypothetical protein QJS10_CPA07g00245 [Acorus calamus]|uniref:Uncharacterized protein n=1 Tax=Acorus calamus TaxID=4465 RepID=A0AAV9EF23_ACOCL|nr:hypothetical protein QJS10_CPA07g00245 [Acorus calamus]